MSILYLFNSLPQPSNKPLPLDTQRGCVSSLGHPTCVTAPGCIVQKQLRCSCEVHFLTTGYACICVYMCLYICSGKPHTPPYWMVGILQCGVSHPTAHACPFLASWGCLFRYSRTSMAVDQPFFNKTCSCIYSAIESNCSCAPFASMAFWPARNCHKAPALSPYSKPTRGRFLQLTPL